MRRVRALVIVSACAIGAVLGMGTFALAQAASGCAGSSGPGLMGAIVRTAAPQRAGTLRASGCEERLGAAVAPDAAVPGGSARRVPASTATRHIPTAGERPDRRGVSPATDRAMALLIGWGTLVLIFGGLCCGRRRPEAEAEVEVEVRAPMVRVRVPRPHSSAPRHLLAAPPRRYRRGLTRAIASVIASTWPGSATGGVSARTAGGRTGAAARVSVGASTAVPRQAAGVGESTVVMRRIGLRGSVARAGINGRRS